MFDVNDFTPILSWQNKVNLDEYQRWVRSVEMNSSDYGSIENIIFLLQKYIFDALSSKYARILQLEERTTENFNREYPTMRGRVPSRCDFSNGMLYYEESFVEGIQTTNGISALQWLYIDKRMPIELSSNFLLMKSGNGISLHINQNV